MPALSQLSTQERHSIIDQQIFISNCERILDRSGLIGWKSRRYTLVATYPTPESNHPDSAVIYMTEFAQHRNQIEPLTYSDCEDIPTHDCPMRIIHAADQYAAINDFAQQWRDQVRYAHTQKSNIMKLLRELARYHPRIDDRIVIWPNQTVHYVSTADGEKRHHQYFTDNEAMTKTLTPDMVNPYATKAVRNQSPENAHAPSQAQATPS